MICNGFSSAAVNDFIPPTYDQLSKGISQYRPIDGKSFWFSLGGEDDSPIQALTRERLDIADKSPAMYGVAEWAYSFYHLKNGALDGAGYKHYGGFPTLPKTRQDAKEVVHSYFNRLQTDAFTKATPDQKKHFFSINGHYCYQHFGAEWGCDIVSSEVGENINSIQMHIAFTRGAARQYAKPWLIDFSSWYGPSIFDEDPTRTWGENSSPTGGHSISLHERTYLASYMSGANMVIAEGGWLNYFRDQTPGSDGNLPLSSLGKAGQSFYQFTKRHPDRGIPYVPVALLIDKNHGIYPGFEGKRAWDVFPYTPGDQSILDILDLFYPGTLGDTDQHEPGDASKNTTAYMQREDLRLGAAPFGDILDVLLTNASQSVLNNYPVIILAGELTADTTLASKLHEYVQQGGTLLTRSADVKLLPFLSIYRHHRSISIVEGDRISIGNGVVFPPGSMPIGRSAFKNLTGGTLAYLCETLIPFDIQGKVETLYNRTPDGWILTLINNEGVSKTFKDLPIIDKSKTQSVKITYHGKDSLKSAILWGLNEDSQLQVSPLTISIPPGESRIIQIHVK